MGRYRPPAPPGSKYVTPEGAARLREELDFLWKKKRPEVTRAVSEAAAQGDRSENAEYIYGKKQLAGIDRRVRFLRKRLDGISIVDTIPSDTSRVYFGAWFELSHENGLITRHRLVGPDEIDHDKAYVSMDSPLGKAIMGKELDAAFAVDTPSGEKACRVVSVRYETADTKKEPGAWPG